MIFPIEIDPLAGVFGFLDATLPEKLREAAEDTDLGIGRLAEASREWWHAMTWKQNPLLGLCETGDERRAIAKILNHSFRLQWKECPLRQFLAEYRLYHRDDMADALAAAYCLHKRGGDPKAALNADYSVNVRGLLYHKEIEEFRNAPKDGYLEFFWREFRPFFEEGDRIVSHVSIPYDYYLLVRGERLVWEVESIHKCMVGVSLKWRAEIDHFKALGGGKAFLNGEFIWPPPDWVNPMTDEQEKAHDEEHRQSFKKLLMGAKADS